MYILYAVHFIKTIQQSIPLYQIKRSPVTGPHNTTFTRSNRIGDSQFRRLAVFGDVVHRDAWCCRMVTSSEYQNVNKMTYSKYVAVSNEGKGSTLLQWYTCRHNIVFNKYTYVPHLFPLIRKGFEVCGQKCAFAPLLSSGCFRDSKAQCTTNHMQPHPLVETCIRISIGTSH